jgi:hypothetical protein
MYPVRATYQQVVTRQRSQNPDPQTLNPQTLGVN